MHLLSIAARKRDFVGSRGIIRAQNATPGVKVVEASICGVLEKPRTIAKTGAYNL
jgi:hypothetical protein